MKTPEEFKAAVYQKRNAAQKRRKRTALGLCLAAVVVLGGGFFALRGLGSPASPAMRRAAPPCRCWPRLPSRTYTTGTTLCPSRMQRNPR